VTSVLLTPYPPGIPLLIPGERFNATIVRYLKFAKSFNQKSPGFDTDIHVWSLRNQPALALLRRLRRAVATRRGRNRQFVIVGVLVICAERLR